MKRPQIENWLKQHESPAPGYDWHWELREAYHYILSLEAEGRKIDEATSQAAIYDEDDVAMLQQWAGAVK